MRIKIPVQYDGVAPAKPPDNQDDKQRDTKVTR
jgi:hypothetical protein